MTVVKVWEDLGKGVKGQTSPRLAGFWRKALWCVLFVFRSTSGKAEGVGRSKLLLSHGNRQDAPKEQTGPGLGCKGPRPRGKQPRERVTVPKHGPSGYGRSFAETASR